MLFSHPTKEAVRDYMQNRNAQNKVKHMPIDSIDSVKQQLDWHMQCNIVAQCSIVHSEAFKPTQGFLLWLDELALTA